MTLDQLRVFVAVAEREHVTRAAEALNMTQSAASAAIASLEREFGARLFHRVGRGIVLTEGGSLLLGEARALLGRAEMLALAMSEFAGLARGRLKIRASQTIASHFLPARLVEFHQAYPGITLAVSVGNSAQVVQAVIGGDAELGFIEGPAEDLGFSQLATELIAHDPLVMVVARQHPLAGKDHLDQGDLASAFWVVREDGSGTRAMFFKAIGMLGLAPADLNIAIELPSNEAVLAAVLAGAGAAVLSESVCADALRAARLVRLPVSLPPRAFHAVQHADRYRTRAVASFLAILRTQIVP
jgi:DNA-binding transcriptional LysR family regulator